MLPPCTAQYGVKNRITAMGYRDDFCRMPVLGAVQITEFTHGVRLRLKVPDLDLNNPFGIGRYRQIRVVRRGHR